jgi:hypothetical protein
MKTDGGTFCSELTFVWKNRIPYIEFQAWMMYSIVRHLAANHR